MTPEEEKRLIKEILAGNADAFAAIVEANQRNVYALALRMTGSPEDAQDIAQEVFLKTYGELGKFRGDSRLSVWLYRMTYNLCIDHLRKQKRRPTQPLYIEEDGEETVLELPDIRYQPETELERKELQEAVQNALQQLSPEHRKILLMREYAGRSYTEIALHLGITEGTVKSRIARARERVAKILIKNGTFPARHRQKTGKEDGLR